MMVLFELMLGIAESVLGNVVTDLTKGRKKVAQMEEIKHEVARQLEEHLRLQRFQQEQLAHILQLVLEEITKLVERDSGLRLSDGQIGLKKRVEIPLLSPKRSVDEELKEQLDQLNMVVIARRQELHLPIQPVKEEALYSTLSENEAHESPVVWKQVHQQEEKPAARELLEMQERIRRWRSGEEVSDE